METVLMVSGIPPRYGTNAQPLNMIHKDLCDNNKVFNDRPGFDINGCPIARGK